MGYHSEQDRRDHIALLNERQRLVDATIAAERERIAQKLVMVLSDNIISDVVRPGPMPEERECYDMAQEIRDHREVLVNLLLAVLNTERVVKKPE